MFQQATARRSSSSQVYWRGPWISLRWLVTNVTAWRMRECRWVARAEVFRRGCGAGCTTSPPLFLFLRPRVKEIAVARCHFAVSPPSPSHPLSPPFLFLQHSTSVPRPRLLYSRSPILAHKSL